MTYVVNQAYTPMVAGLGSGNTFYFFAAICALSFLWIWRYLFETKGRTLEEIQQLLKGEQVDEGLPAEQFRIKALGKS